MIEKRTLARPYAKALFELLKTTQDYDRWLLLLQTLSLIVSNPKVLSWISDQTVPKEKLTEFMLSVTSSTVDALGRNFIRLLVEKHRLGLLPEILALFVELQAEAEKKAIVVFKSSIPLNEAQKAYFSKHFSEQLHCAVLMQYQVDSSLVGGFIGRSGNYVLDGSLKGNLGLLKEAMGG